MRLEEDPRMAQVSARAFAESHKIPFIKEVQGFDRPIMTVVKYNSKWHPAVIHPEVTKVILKLAGTQDEAVHSAKLIAEKQNLDCIPSIGISAYSDQPFSDSPS